MRKREERVYQIQEKNTNLNKRLEKFIKLKDLNINNVSLSKIPDNEGQVVILFASLLSNRNNKKYIKYIDLIAHYSYQSTTDLICISKEGTPLLVEIEFLLSNIFKHDHPFNTFDCIVCWKVDLEINEKRKLIDGYELKLILEKGEWYLKYGLEKLIPIIELSSIVNCIIQCSACHIKML